MPRARRFNANTLVRWCLFAHAASMIGCGAAQAPAVELPTEAPPRDPAKLAAAVEAYYTASTAQEMRAAVAAAKAAGPGTAGHHEVAADLARLEDRRADQLDHLLASLRDPSSDAPLSPLHTLAELSWTLPERARVEATLAALVAQHPDPEVRAFAGWMLAHALHMRGDDAGREAALASAGFRLDFAIIGTWDNDQGKGFDAEQPPEREIDLGKTYPAKRTEARWRTDYVRDPRGKTDLAAVLEPNQWRVAYAAAAVQVSEGGDYELRVSSADPVKVWVNEVLVFEGRRLDTWLFDGLTIPVKLRAGVNRVLVKSAQQTGSWLLVARITRPDGVPVADGALKSVAADTPYATSGPQPGQTHTESTLLERRMRRIGVASARRAFLHAVWAAGKGLGAPAVDLAEAMVKRWPKSLRGRYLLAAALWNNQERGRTADLLNALVAETGREMPFVALKQARFWQQQKLEVKARELLVSVREAHPDRPGAIIALADLMRGEGWHEDRCQLLEEADRRWPDWPRVQQALADCYKELRFYPRASKLYGRLLQALPADPTLLEALHWQAQGNDDYEAAKRYARQLTRAWPHRRTAWQRLGETLRRAGDREGAHAAWSKLVEIAPDSADGYERLAGLAMQAGERDEAVRLWKQALQRDPENDRLANRLAWIAPEDEGLWAADVPDEADIDKAVRARDSMKAEKGTNVVYLMDDEVTSLGADGSTANVVTMVAHAVNQEGRDQLTRMSVRAGGRSRILHAYAVDPAGRRIEASSIRGRSVRFRQLTTGSTVVLQYRLDERPDGYLSGHMARQWWFQSPGVQTLVSRWVLWTPAGTPLLEYVQGDVKRDQRREGDLERVVWIAEHTAPVVPEPAMPTIHEVASHIVVSTVPDWEMFWKWEQALLRDAFRESPELVELAEKLFAGATDPEEKVRRIHAYLMTNIRYQQDYERHIAGVKPHAAPIVVARQYGDCKDKAVLFIALARLAKIRVDFALVRTRNAGPVRREVPMQQFNHAIVYVPEQDGIAVGRFFDPTVDALDVDVLRRDDQGTWSLVYDVAGRGHSWKRIPYQAAAIDYSHADAQLRLTRDGGATGEIEITAHGRLGETLRRMARNPEHMQQLLQREVGGTFAGARMLSHETLQVDDVRRPAKVRVALETDNLGRREGGELRMKLPIGWSPQRLFTLAERRHPLVLGAPRTWRWRFDLQLPEGGRVKRVPSDRAVRSECLSLTRTMKVVGDTVVGEQIVEILCERIAPGAYAAHREGAERMLKLLEEELVVDVGRKRAGRPTASR